MKIGKKLINSKSKTYFIADIAANHDGSLFRAKKLIKLCAKAETDAAKFQHFKAETIVSDYGFKSVVKLHIKRNGKKAFSKFIKMQVLTIIGQKNYRKSAQNIKLI